MVAYVVMSLINSFVFMPLGQDASNEGWMHAYLPFFSILMLLCGLTSGILGLIAVIHKRERSWMIWVTLLPFAFVLFMLLGEFLVPH
jgi:hypothetical protein